jgi:Flp pilus assembly protein TadD
MEPALQNLMRASELAPDDPRAYKLLGRLLDRMGRTEEAMVMHRKAREAGH